MENYLLMIYVTLEQEGAIRELFRLRDWIYKRKDLEKCDSPIGDLCSISSEDVDLQTPPAESLDLHTISNKDSELHTISNKDSDLHTISNKDSELHTISNKDSELHTISNKDSELHTISNKDEDVHTNSTNSSDLVSFSNRETEKCKKLGHSSVHRGKPDTSITVKEKKRFVKSTVKETKKLKYSDTIVNGIQGDTVVNVDNVRQRTIRESNQIIDHDKAVVTNTSNKGDDQKDLNKFDANRSDKSIYNNSAVEKIDLSENLSDDDGNDKNTKSSASVLKNKTTPPESKSAILRRSRRKRTPFKFAKIDSSDIPVLYDTDLIEKKSESPKERSDNEMHIKVENESTELDKTQHSITVLDEKLNTSSGAQTRKAKEGSGSKTENKQKKKKGNGSFCKKSAEEVVEFLKRKEDNFPVDVKLKVQDLLKSFGNKNGIKNLKCIYCTRVFSTRYNYILHIDKHTKKKFDCPECGKKFGNHRNLNAHRYGRSNFREFICHLCDFKTTTVCLLRTHNKEEHPASIYFQCHICPMVLKTKSYLNVHLKQVHGIYDAKYECPICGKKCKRQKHFQKHVKEHNNEPSRQCKVCGKIFSSKAHLQSHKRIHGERKHKCKQCGKSFVTITKLRGHERIHSGLKPFACTFCDYKTSQSGNLKSHMKIHQRDGESKPSTSKSKLKTSEIKQEEEKGPSTKNDAIVSYESASQQQDWYTGSYEDQSLVYGDTGNPVYQTNVDYQASKNVAVKKETTQIHKDFYNINQDHRGDQYNVGYNELESYQNYYNAYDNQYYDSSNAVFVPQDESVIGNTSKQAVTNNEINVKPFTASKLFQAYNEDTSQTLQQQQQSHQPQHYDGQAPTEHSQPVQTQSITAQTLYHQGTGSNMMKHEVTVKVGQQQHQNQQHQQQYDSQQGVKHSKPGQTHSVLAHLLGHQEAGSKVMRQGFTGKVAQQQQNQHHQQHFNHQSYKQQLNQQASYTQHSYNHLYQSSSQTEIFQTNTNSDPSQQQSMYGTEVYTGMGKHLNEIRPNVETNFRPTETETYGTVTGKSGFTNSSDPVYLGSSSGEQYMYEIPQSLQFNKQVIKPEYDLNPQTSYPDAQQTH